MKTIETSKCIFYIKDIPSLDLVYNDKLNEYLLSLEIIKLSEITELEASEVIDFMPLKYDGEIIKCVEIINFQKVIIRVDYLQFNLCIH